MGEGFMSNTAANHWGVFRMFWLDFWGDLTWSMFLVTHHSGLRF